MTDFVADGVDRIRREAPLVHNVTNLVAMTLSANVLIAAGASPIMSAAPEEAGDPRRLLRCPGGQYRHADPRLDRRRARRRRGRPSRRPAMDPRPGRRRRHRRSAARPPHALIAQQPRIIRGNASEIMALAGRRGAAARASTAPPARMPPPIGRASAGAWPPAPWSRSPVRSIW